MGGLFLVGGQYFPAGWCGGLNGQVVSRFEKETKNGKFPSEVYSAPSFDKRHLEKAGPRKTFAKKLHRLAETAKK